MASPAIASKRPSLRLTTRALGDVVASTIIVIVVAPSVTILLHFLSRAGTRGSTTAATNLHDATSAAHHRIFLILIWQRPLHWSGPCQPIRRWRPHVHHLIVAAAEDTRVVLSGAAAVDLSEVAFERAQLSPAEGIVHEHTLSRRKEDARAFCATAGGACHRELLVCAHRVAPTPVPLPSCPAPRARPG